jgi:hypothetical protein
MRYSLILLLLLATTVLTRNLRQERKVQPKLDGPDQLSHWDFDGTGSWDISAGKLVLNKAGTPSGPYRRPAALAILKSEPFKSVTMDLYLRSTAPLDVARRDLDLVVGYESPARFYYIHLSAITDDVHNGIFLVADADRRRIDSGKGVPRLKDQSWHRVQVMRDGSSGRIEVFFDNSRTPILSAVDTTIQTGRVGVGSFDDTGEFQKIVVKGTLN